MPDDFISQTYSRIRDGELEVLGVFSIDGDSPQINLQREDGGALTRDEHYAVVYMLYRGRVVLVSSAKNFYEVQAKG